MILKELIAFFATATLIHMHKNIWQYYKSDTSLDCPRLIWTPFFIKLLLLTILTAPLILEDNVPAHNSISERCKRQWQTMQKFVIARVVPTFLRLSQRNWVDGKLFNFCYDTRHLLKICHVMWLQKCMFDNFEALDYHLYRKYQSA